MYVLPKLMEIQNTWAIFMTLSDIVSEKFWVKIRLHLKYCLIDTAFSQISLMFIKTALSSELVQKGLCRLGLYFENLLERVRSTLLHFVMYNTEWPVWYCVTPYWAIVIYPMPIWPKIQSNVCDTIYWIQSSLKTDHAALLMMFISHSFPFIQLKNDFKLANDTQIYTFHEMHTYQKNHEYSSNSIRYCWNIWFLLSNPLFFVWICIVRCNEVCLIAKCS